MQDVIEIGSSPVNEACAQVGQPDYETIARRECQQFIIAIRRKLGTEPKYARLVVKANPHDYGTYYEVVVRFDASNKAASTYAYRCESDSPVVWTKEDKEALA